VTIEPRRILTRRRHGPEPPAGRRLAPYRPYSRLVIPQAIIEEAQGLIREFGVQGRERFLLLAGSLAEESAFASSLVIPPDCQGFVPIDVVARIIGELDRLDLIPLCQIHSHPHEAFLSEIDAQYPMFAEKGFLSIVVPDYCRRELSAVGLWKVYRYLDSKTWEYLPKSRVERMIVIDPQAVHI
jgi:hypothetical protein